jgi:UDP-N-acetylmuramate dehydrogenase
MTPLIEGEEFLKPLYDFTSWRIGGPAARFFYPKSIAHLTEYMQHLPQNLPVVWLGLGSNVLIRDGGIDGAVICTLKLQDLYQQEDGTIVADAGVTCAKLARFATKLGFADAAFFAGIPGTVGGALAMNAGAFGGETWQWVQSVSVLNRQGHHFQRPASDYDIAYRSVRPKLPEQTQEAFMGATFRFMPHADMQGAEKIKELLRKRNMTQPIGTHNCGSVYRNPNGDFAARLIEACELKGYRIGDAVISPKHANFIINCGNARSDDVEMLMATIESKVKARFGVELHPEVKILGQRGK